MARLSKLLRTYEAVIRGGSGGVSFGDFEALLRALGFELARQAGSHRICAHPKLERPFPIQPDGKDAKRYQIREPRDIIRKYRLSLD